MPAISTATKTSSTATLPAQPQTVTEATPAKVPAVSPQMLEGCIETLSHYRDGNSKEVALCLGILRKALGAPADATIALHQRRDNGSAVMLSEDGQEKYAIGNIVGAGATSGIPFSIRLNNNHTLEFELGDGPSTKLRSGELSIESMRALLGVAAKIDRKNESLSYIASGSNDTALATVFSQKTQTEASAIYLHGKSSEPLKIIGSLGSEYDRTGRLLLLVASNGESFSAFRIRNSNDKYMLEKVGTSSPTRRADGEITFTVDGAGEVKVPGTSAALRGETISLNGKALEE